MFSGARREAGGEHPKLIPGGGQRPGESAVHLLSPRRREAADRGGLPAHPPAGGYGAVKALNFYTVYF